ncbi:hypothetical protein H6800_02370 [Candidatus Nomurabacteria bacterium]|nr:hypothetical protein [Candidatus Nomurabacteria bacterium]
MKIVKVSIPEYDTSKELNLKGISKKIDHALVKNFDGKKVILRAVSSEAHDKSQAELVEVIKNTGSDRYDPIKKGDRYDNVHDKQIDLFGQTKIIQSGKNLSIFILKGFHVYGQKYHKKPSNKMDIWMVYDRSKLKYVTHYYEKYMVMKRDGYIFRDQNNKAGALLGILVIN